MAAEDLLFQVWSFNRDQTEIGNRGRSIGLLGAIGAWVGLTSLMVVGYLMQLRDPSGESISTYSFAFRIAGVFYILAIGVVLIIPEKTRLIVSSSKDLVDPAKPLMFRLKSAILDLKPEFKKLLVIEGIFRITWSFAWPIFPSATLAATDNWGEIAYLMVGMGVASGLSQLYGGRLSDRIGRNKIILVSRVVLVIPPVLYGLGAVYGEPMYLLVSNILVGLIIGAGGVSVNSLILDIAPEEKQATYFSIYLTTMGLLSFSGSLLMGGVLLIVSADDVPSNSLLLTLFGIVAFFRFIAWIGYFFLPKEKAFS
jgi:MFS family permease